MRPSPLRVLCDYARRRHVYDTVDDDVVLRAALTTGDGYGGRRAHRGTENGGDVAYLVKLQRIVRGARRDRVCVCMRARERQTERD